jgi:hypothetical protein
MQLDALRGLAKSLAPLGKCRFLEPGSTQRSAFTPKTADPDGKSIDEVFDRIDEAGSWIALYNVENDPVYNAFLEDATRGVRALSIESNREHSSCAGSSSSPPRPRSRRSTSTVRTISGSRSVGENS